MYHEILISAPKSFNINQKNDFTQQQKTLVKQNTKDITFFESMDEVNYTYNGKFEGNILVAGWIGCGKTAFVQNLGKHKIIWRH